MDKEKEIILGLISFVGTMIIIYLSIWLFS